jgi:hypothetical protein
VFRPERIGEAVARLYERYADTLPDGPARQRAAATARSVAVFAPGGFQLDRDRAFFRSDVEITDHRLLGGGSSMGVDFLLRSMAEAKVVGNEIVSDGQDVLALTNDALLMRWLTSGVDAESGGELEWAFLRLFVFDDDGQVARYELFDDEREAEALARFEKLVGSQTRTPVRCEARRNVAIRSLEQFATILNERDRDALVSLFDETLHVVHHPTGATYGRREMLGVWRSAMKAARLEYTSESLASLGDHLALERHVTVTEGLTGDAFEDFGLMELDEIGLVECDDDGCWIHIEVFAPEHLGKAIARLYERYADRMPEGAERDRAMSVAVTFSAFMLYADDYDRLATVLTPDIEGIDHRLMGSSSQGAEAYLEQVSAWPLVADDIAFVTTDILVLTEDGLLARTLHRGTNLEFGGAYERPFLSLFKTNSEGRLRRIEWFADDQEVQALARFEAVVGGTTSRRAVQRQVLPNAASIAEAALIDALAARDWPAVTAALAEGMAATDHRWHTSYGRDEVVRTTRGFMSPVDVQLRSELIATLGEWLSLSHHRISASGSRAGAFDVGAHTNEYLQLLEVDGTGLIQRLEFFGTDRLSDALIRLYERYAVGLPEGSERELATKVARSVAAWSGPIELDVMRRHANPSCQNVDHRHLHTWSTRGLDELLVHYGLQLELAPDFALRDEAVLATSPRAFLVRRTYFGTSRDTGGAFENPLLVLFTFDSDGLYIHTEVWEVGQEAEALARFDELVCGAKGNAEIGFFDNAASRADRALFDRFNARDWPGIESLAAPELVFDERRRMLRNTCGREIWLEQFRVLYDVPESRFTTQVLATRGERLALSLHRFTGRVADGGGPLEMDDHLVLHEVDRDGRITAIVLFDLEDERDAFAELDTRYEAGEARAFPLARLGLMNSHHINNRAWDAYAAGLAPDYIYRDHRLLGWGDAGNDKASMLEIMQSLADLSPDSYHRRDHVRMTARGLLRSSTLVGTRDGGAFENPLLEVHEVDDQGRTWRSDTYNTEDLDRALARFAELQRSASPESAFANVATLDRELVRPNLASSWLHRFQPAFNARDWDAIEDLIAANPRYEDRQRYSLVSGDRDVLIASLKERAGSGARLERIQAIATAGDRLTLQRVLWAGGGDDGRFEIEFIVVQEVDEEGRLVTNVNFDPTDRADAFDALIEREAASGDEPTPGVVRELARAMNDHDLDRIRSILPENLVIHDHRRTGYGRLEGVDAFIASVVAAIELSPDVRWDTLRRAAVGPHGCVLVNVRWGTNTEGGEYESHFVAVQYLEDGGFERGEMFEIEDLDEALARFDARAEEAGSEPASHDFENTASRMCARMTVLWLAREWDRLLALLPASFRCRDRRGHSQLELDSDEYIRSIRVHGDMADRSVDNELIATRGDRLSLISRRMVLSGGDVGPSELSSLSLFETDEHGDLVEIVHFDEADLDAARAELDARFAAGEASSFPRLQPTLAMLRNTDAARDPEVLGTMFSPNFVYRDHRLLGWGDAGRDGNEMLAIRQTLSELAPDARYHKHHIQICARGVLSRITLSGTRDGGAFENPFISVIEVDERSNIVSNDTYDVEDLDRAFARFAELSEPVAPESPFANDATRLIDRFEAAWDARDWAAIESSLSQDMRQSDRRDLMHLELNRSEHLESLRFSYEMASSQFTTEVLATRGDDLALARTCLALSDAEVGPSEIEFLSIWEANVNGEVRKFTRFNSDDLDAAFAELDARAAALSANASSSEASNSHVVVIPANAASRWVDRFRPEFNARNWNAVKDLFSRDIHYEDRQRHSLVSGGYDVTMASLRARADSGARQEGTQILATAGDRFVLHRSLLAGGSDDSRFETEFLGLQEVDEAGRLVTNINFDMDNRAAAQAELFERYVASGADQAPAAHREVQRALNEHDLDRMRALLPDDFAIEDYRRTGVARLEGADAWIASLTPLFELTPDARFDTLYYAAEGPHGEVKVLRRWGTNAEGGDVESVFVALQLFKDGLWQAAESYEIEDLDRALARFAELERNFGS